MTLSRAQLCTELRIAKKIPETSDTASLVLEIPNDLKNKFKYKSGQFVTFFMDIQGEEIHRSYSLASAPDVDSDFKVTVKLVPGGKGSTYLVQKVREGEKLWTTPPAGLFCLHDPVNNNSMAFYAAGSGITPIISMIKSALQTSEKNRCTLIYQNRHEDNIIFKNELSDLEEKYEGRFFIEHILSQPGAKWSGRRGRISTTSVRDFLTKHVMGIRTQHYMCGPDGFMTAVETALNELNVPKDKVWRESFTTPAQEGKSPSANHIAGATASSAATGGTAGAAGTTVGSNASDADFKIPTGSVVIGDKNSAATPETIEAVIDGETHTVKANPKISVLEALIEAGFNPPYSCMDGACMACMAKVDSGVVFQGDAGILTDDNIDAGECLTCQARPASKKVRINYNAI